jgi:glycosyltransferase involved in cell wall biosynthesis
MPTVNFDIFFDFLLDLERLLLPDYILALLAVFALCVFIQLCFYWFTFRKATARTKRAAANHTRRPVSVIICATNEHNSLEKNLPKFLGQDYPTFEVIVVNDCSTDDTETLLHTLKRKYNHLQISSIEPDKKFRHDRKLALTIGIKAARYDSILFTEAGCEPQSKNWLSAMQKAFSDKTEAVIGYCRNAPRGGLIDKLQRADSVYSALFSLSAARRGKPYRASIRSMGLSQSMFFRNKGFANYHSYANSEETIFFCRNANAKNTAVVLHPDAILVSSQRLTFKQWFIQRCQYASLLVMGKRGLGRIKVELLSRLFYYLTAAALISYAVIFDSPIVLAGVSLLMLIRLMSRVSVYRRAQRRLKERKLFLGLMMYDLYSPLLMLIVALARPNLHKVKRIK